jgi:hypothetical protein
VVDESNKSSKEYLYRMAYYMMLFLSLYSTQMWKQAKWAAIRDMWINEHNKKKLANEEFKQMKQEKTSYSSR